MIPNKVWERQCNKTCGFKSIFCGDKTSTLRLAYHPVSALVCRRAEQPNMYRQPKGPVKHTNYITPNKKIPPQMRRDQDGICLSYYIMGIPPPPGMAGAGFSSFFSMSALSVVRIIPPTEAAFSMAIRVTFFGSIMPALSIWVYLPFFTS